MRARVVFAAACLTACAAPADPSAGDPQEIVAAPDGRRSPPSAADIARADVPTPDPPKVAHAYACRSDAFCEDFESADPFARWTSSTTTGPGALDLLAPSASLGARSMHARAGDPTATAYLHESGPGASAHLAGAFGFAIRLDALPSATLGGPRLAVDLPTGIATIGITVTADGFFLEQRSEGVDLAIPIGPATADAWHRITVGLEANEAAVAPYGRVEVSIDGGDLAAYKLVVPVYAGPLELHAGITRPDPTATSLELDDVMFFTF